LAGPSITSIIGECKPKKPRKDTLCVLAQLCKFIPSRTAAKIERYKLIRFYGMDVPGGEEWEFYDLERDPTEMNNSYNNPENAAKISELKKELDRLKDYYKVDEPPPQKKRG
jgi:hypothetical protein